MREWFRVWNLYGLSCIAALLFSLHIAAVLVSFHIAAELFRDRVAMVVGCDSYSVPDSPWSEFESERRDQEVQTVMSSLSNHKRHQHENIEEETAQVSYRNTYTGFS